MKKLLLIILLAASDSCLAGDFRDNSDNSTINDQFAPTRTQKEKYKKEFKEKYEKSEIKKLSCLGSSALLGRLITLREKEKELGGKSNKRFAKQFLMGTNVKPDVDTKYAEKMNQYKTDLIFLKLKTVKATIYLRKKEPVKNQDAYNKLQDKVLESLQEIGLLIDDSFEDFDTTENDTDNE